METKEHRPRILLGQLVKNGDCLHATILARQIKTDFPGCHLTWAVSSLCRAMVENNPDVDAIWEVPLPSWEEDDQNHAWFDFERQALHLHARGEFDAVFLTQTHIANPHLFDGTIRPSLFRAYPRPITVPLQPVIELRDSETAHVRDFVEKHLRSFERVILFESSAGSAQSQMNPHMALQIAHALLDEHPDRYAIICSSQTPLPGPARRGLIDGSALSLRQMAALAEHCHLFIGCNSGITQAVTAAKRPAPLPMIQVLTSARSVYSSIVYDLHYWRQPSGHILEMFDGEVPAIVRAVQDVFVLGWEKARRLHHQEIKEDFSYLASVFQMTLLDRNDPLGLTIALTNATRRYGWRPEFEQLLSAAAARFLKVSPGASLPDREEILRRIETRALEPDAYVDLQSPFRTRQFVGQYPLSMRPLTLQRAQNPEPPHAPDVLAEVGLALHELKSSSDRRARAVEPQRGGIESTLIGDGKRDAQSFLSAAVDWARQKNKKWLVLAHDPAELNDFTLTALQEELRPDVHPQPLYSWKIDRSILPLPFALSRKAYFYPCLLILPTEWAQRHLPSFAPLSLKNDRWLLTYAATMLRLIEQERSYREQDFARGIHAPPATSVHWIFPAPLAHLQLILKSETVMLLGWKLTEFRFARRARLKAARLKTTHPPRRH